MSKHYKHASRALRDPEVLALLHETKVKIGYIAGREVKVWVVYDMPADTLPIEEILRDAAEASNVSCDDLLSPKRDRDLVMVRQAVVYFLRRKTKRTDEEIAAAMNRERTFCNHSYQTATELLLQANTAFMERFYTLSQLFKSYDRREAVSQ